MSNLYKSGCEFTRAVREALGLADGAHYPDEGISPRRVLHGLFVWITPVAPRGRFKSSKHRLFAACPSCGRAVPVGRFYQHRCNSKRNPARPVAFHFTEVE